MLLVYAMTRATEIGWGTAETIGLLAASAALILSFVAIELRSKAPLLPMRIFRLRSLAGANVTSFLVGTALFSQFFLGTLYMQQVLHYSALKTGVAYLPLTLTIIALAGVAQALVTRVGVRRVLPVGLVAGRGRARPAGAAAGRRPLLLGRLPGLRDQRDRPRLHLHPADDRGADGRPGVRRRRRLRAAEHDAADRRGDRPGRRLDDRDHLHRATTSTDHPGASPLSGPALTYGFQITFYVLAGVAALAAVLAAVMIEPKAAEAVPVRRRAGAGPALEAA